MTFKHRMPMIQVKAKNYYNVLNVGEISMLKQWKNISKFVKKFFNKKENNLKVVNIEKQKMQKEIL